MQITAHPNLPPLQGKPAVPGASCSPTVLPALGKLPNKFLHFSKGNKGGKTEQGPATQPLRNPCTKIQLLKSSSYLFHMHCQSSHCEKALFSLSNQQQLLIHGGNSNTPALQTPREHANSLRAEVWGATHTASSPEYGSCLTGLPCSLQPFATASLRTNHILASPAPWLQTLHFSQNAHPKLALHGIRTQCTAAGREQTSHSKEIMHFTHCI